MNKSDLAIKVLLNVIKELGDDLDVTFRDNEIIIKRREDYGFTGTDSERARY